MDARPCIMFIDNNLANQRLLVAVLSPYYELIAPTSDGEALRKLHEVTPNLILLDMGAPNLGGLQICRRIRAMPKQAQTPIVFLSGINSRENLLLALQCGGDDFIPTPYDIEILCAKIGVHLQYRQGVPAAVAFDRKPCCLQCGAAVPAN